MTLEYPKPYTVKLTAFEGPMEVLWILLKRKDGDNTHIAGRCHKSVHRICRGQGDTAGLIADFLSVAARLLIIKAKALLPFLTLSQEEEEELVDFEARLKLLQQYRAASKGLRSLIRKKRFAYGKEASTAFSVTFYPPKTSMRNI